ncbi:MAG: beta-ketoacyl-[acyl-carrier-protein] synthase family protein [Planctomycetes bacterium]|nr:beta-ketoacyl-[acyl-carrier-protein] synthase family protein [Planctomycetota bacterium]
MRRRVAVTGIGLVTPLGDDPDTFLRRLLAGESGVGPITLFDPATLPTRIAAEARVATALRDRKVTFALTAARRALEAASACGSRPRGAGAVSLGLGLELFSMDDMARARAPGFALPEGQLERLTFLQTPTDLVVPLISRELGLTAPPRTHVSACAAGADALGAAFRLVATGRRDWMLAGGSDSMIHPLGVGGFCKLTALSTRNDAPTRASRPFDRARDGFVLGEGAGVVVLEPLDEAVARGATVLGEVVGYGSSFDAHGISEPHPEARGALQAMTRALDDAGLRPEAIDCVNAHGTGTPKNDPVEALALRRLLGDRLGQVPVCATKSMIGHLIAAAGAVEAIAALLCLRAGVVHGNPSLEEPDPACADLDLPRAAREHPQRHVLSTSYGFGGQNAALVLRRHDA